MPTKKPLKVRLSLNNAVDFIAQLVRDERSVEVIRTGYTIQANTPRRRYFFSDTGTSFACFHAAARIARDIGEVGFSPAPASPGEVKYYRVPVDTALPLDAVCVDIKAAYPTTLRNLGAISTDTFNLCMKLPKPDRLKCVGMLATSKNVQLWQRGKLVSVTQEENPLRPCFYAACKAVGTVMENLSNLIDDSFCFYWVDGAFMRCDGPRVGYACEYLSDCGYRTTSEQVSRLRRSASGRYIFYTKGGKSTYLPVPQRVELEDEDLWKAIDALGVPDGGSPVWPGRVTFA